MNSAEQGQAVTTSMLQGLPSKAIVVVTGGTGYIAGHIINELLKRNYYVIATLRSLSKTQSLIDNYPKVFHERLEVRRADLLDEDSWMTAFQKVDYVIHTAAPFPLSTKDSEAEKLVSTTVNGAKFVVNAAKANKVKKLIMTSSALTTFGHFPKTKKYFTEKDWADESQLPPYDRSKLQAERAAWEAVGAGEELEMVSILPAFVIGPTLTKSEHFSSMHFIEMLFRNKSFPYIFIPKNLNFCVVDVRDVALAHVKALELAGNHGRRYLLCESTSKNFGFNFDDVAYVLRQEFEQYGYKLKPISVGILLLKASAKFNKDMEFLVNCYKTKYYIDNTPAVKELGIEFIDYAKSFIDMVYSLIEKGLIRDLVSQSQSQMRSKL
jgi:dihydroflavonol-4-reductase